MDDYVILVDKDNLNGSRHLSATVQSDGTLSIEGQDLRGTQGEYEWAFSIRSPEVERLKTALGCGDDVLAALAAEFSGDAASGLEPFLKSKGIAYEFWSRIGD